MGERARQCVAQLHVFQAQIGGVVHVEVGRQPVVVRVHGAVAGIVVGSALTRPAAEHPRGQVGHGDVSARGGIEDITSRHALPHHREIETAPVGRQRESEGPVAGHGVGLNHRSFGIDVCLHFGHVLEHAVGLVAIEEGERLSVLCAGDGSHALQVVIVLIARVVAQIDELVAQIGSVAFHVETGIGHAELIAGFEFHARVFHLSHIADGTS